MVRKYSIEERMERIEAVKACSDLLAKYEYWHCCNMFAEHVDLFAKRDDTLAQVGTWGLYKGYQGIKKLYAGMHMGASNDPRPGTLFEHHLTTELVEVAGDGKTAKGVWMSPGHETVRDAKTGKLLQLGWCWVKYGVDFIKEKGEWKIWHLFVFLTLWADFDKSWEKSGEHPTGPGREHAIPKPPGLEEDAPSIFLHQPYDPNTPREFCPAFPEPYDTYDEKEGVYWMDKTGIKRKPAYIPPQLKSKK
jgi:hypothetical protein